MLIFIFCFFSKEKKKKDRKHKKRNEKKKKRNEKTQNKMKPHLIEFRSPKHCTSNN